MRAETSRAEEGSQTSTALSALDVSKVFPKDYQLVSLHAPPRSTDG